MARYSPRSAAGLVSAALIVAPLLLAGCAAPYSRSSDYYFLGQNSTPVTSPMRHADNARSADNARYGDAITGAVLAMSAASLSPSR